MIAALTHAANVARAALHELRKHTLRSAQWPRVERMHLKAHPLCAACGGTAHLQVHHKVAFAANPALELDGTNLLTLCMGPPECHLRLGHGGSFRYYNPWVQHDADAVRAFPQYRELAETEARANRVPMHEAVEEVAA